MNHASSLSFPLPKESSPLQEGLAYIDHQLRELMFCFREVLEELGEGDVAAALPWITSQPRTTPDATHARSWEQATSLSFQLLNIVEAHAAFRARQRREREQGLVAERGLWAEQLLQLKEAGYTGEEIAAFLPQVHVEPVFTAHPTEAKRGSVLEQHRLLCQLLSQGEGMTWSRAEKKEWRNKVKLSLEKLWRSGEIFLERPTVADERRGILFYLKNVLPSSLTLLEERLEAAWEEVGLDPQLLEEHSLRPKLSFGTWVGGDRDGHPFVTPEVTEETLMALRRGALMLLDKELGDLARALPLSGYFQEPSAIFLKELAKLEELLGEEGTQIRRHHPHEPWRAYVLMLKSMLPLRFKTHEHLELFDSVHSCSSPKQLLHYLQTLEESLVAIQGKRLVKEALAPVLRIITVFGFHLATLDIRQNSDFHDRAMAQLLEALGVEEGASFTSWSEEQRLQFLHYSLAQSGRLLPQEGEKRKSFIASLGKEATTLLATYQVVATHRERFGDEGLGSFIVSMTRQLSDLLVVLFVAREVGLTCWNGVTHYLTLPVIPLFETVEDLEQSPRLMEAYLNEPSTEATLAFWKKEKGKKLPALQVMVGYSDSNKDSGIMASQWQLYEAQRLMSQLAEQRGVKIRFFHGRGGTISRGAGPTHRFLEALAPSSLQGDLRMTEQGETIAQKYDHPTTATYHLELLLAGVTRVGMMASQPKETSLVSEEIISFTSQVAPFLAQRSRDAYHQLIQKPGFLNFYQEATPIDALEVSRIGSRPKKRSGTASRSLEDLRAIPWVFSWNQSRYYLPGWYGVGTALEALQQEEPVLWQELLVRYRQSPFLHYVLSNVETNVASADLEVMEQYANLVSDIKIRSTLFGMIREEFCRTKEQLEQLFGSSLEERRPRTAKTIALRQEPLALLHREQIVLLQEWRASILKFPEGAANTPPTEELLPKVLLSINAIASGLRTTG